MAGACPCTSSWRPAPTGSACATAELGRFAALLQERRRSLALARRLHPLRQHRGHDRPHLRPAAARALIAPRSRRLARARPAAAPAAHRLLGGRHPVRRDALRPRARRHLALRPLALARDAGVEPRAPRRPTSRCGRCSPGRRASRRSRTCRPGASVGYGCTYRTTRPTRLAVLPVGYWDGYDRGLSNIGARAGPRARGAGARPRLHEHDDGGRDRHPRRRARGRGGAARRAGRERAVTAEEMAAPGSGPSPTRC